MSLRILLICLAVATADAADLQKYDYQVLEVEKISTMEERMNEAAAEDYSFQTLMGSRDHTLVLVMEKPARGDARGNKKYKLLLTSVRAGDTVHVSRVPGGTRPGN